MTPTLEEAARAVLEASCSSVCHLPPGGCVDECELRKAKKQLATALSAPDPRDAEIARLRGSVPAGHVRLPDGRDVKVLGELPMTADGVIVVPMMSGVYHPNHPESLDVDVCGDRVVGCHSELQRDRSVLHTEYEIGECYSTRESCERGQR